MTKRMRVFRGIVCCVVVAGIAISFRHPVLSVAGPAFYRITGKTYNIPGIKEPYFWVFAEKEGIGEKTTYKGEHWWNSSFAIINLYESEKKAKEAFASLDTVVKRYADKHDSAFVISVGDSIRISGQELGDATMYTDLISLFGDKVFIVYWRHPEDLDTTGNRLLKSYKSLTGE